MWGSWSSCSVSCSGGSTERLRSVVTVARHGGSICATLNESDTCGNRTCPSDCMMAGWWSSWSSCSVSCGAGQKTRLRSVLTPPVDGGERCGATHQSKYCDVAPCVEPCMRDSWTAWSECDESCGSGRQTRSQSRLSGECVDEEPQQAQRCTELQCNPNVRSHSIANLAVSGGLQLTLLGSGFGSIDTSLIAAVGSSVCSSTAWISDSAVLCISQITTRIESDAPLSLYVTVAQRVSPPLRLALRYDAAVVTSMSPINLAPSAAAVATINGLNLNEWTLLRTATAV